MCDDEGADEVEDFFYWKKEDDAPALDSSLYDTLIRVELAKNFIGYSVLYMGEQGADVLEEREKEGKDEKGENYAATVEQGFKLLQDEVKE